MYIRIHTVIMSSPRKYRSLSTNQKKEVIEAVEAGEKQADVAAQFKVGRSTISMILKKKDRW